MCIYFNGQLMVTFSNYRRQCHAAVCHRRVIVLVPFRWINTINRYYLITIQTGIVHLTVWWTSLTVYRFWEKINIMFEFNFGRRKWMHYNHGISDHNAIKFPSASFQWNRSNGSLQNVPKKRRFMFIFKNLTNSEFLKKNTTEIKLHY